MKTSLFIGKFNPFHEGHKAIIDSLLLEGRKVFIMPRRRMGWDEWFDFNTLLNNIYGDKVILISDRFFDEVVHGRDTNYKFREIKLPKELEKFSSTNIREGKA